MVVFCDISTRLSRNIRQHNQLKLLTAGRFLFLPSVTVRHGAAAADVINQDSPRTYNEKVAVNMEVHYL